MRASLRGGHFLWKGAYARFHGKLAFAKCFRERPCFQLLETRVATSSWPHLPLHWHLFLPLHGHIFPFNGHIFPFMATYSPSSAHLPLHWHLFAFIGTSSPSWVHLRFKDTWRGGVGGTWFASARAFARLSPAYARDPEPKMPTLRIGDVDETSDESGDVGCFC